MLFGHLHGGRRIRTNVRRGLRPRGHDVPRLQEHVAAALGVAGRRRRCQQQTRRGTLGRRRRVPPSPSSSAIELDLARPERVGRQHGRAIAALLPVCRGARDGGDCGDHAGGSGWSEVRAGGGGDGGGRGGGVEERRRAVRVGGGQRDQLWGWLRRRRAGTEGISVARRQRGQGDICGIYKQGRKKSKKWRNVIHFVSLTSLLLPSPGKDGDVEGGDDERHREE